MILHMCQKFGIRPEEAIFVGDSRFDMMAAKAAGCLAVGIKANGGDVRIESLADLAKVPAIVQGTSA
jgi:phosphoglycolate phosphatase-like HAD superfamily hydrolase